MDEEMQVTGHHRKALVRALGPRSDGGRDQRRGRPRQYGHETAAVLKAAREASDRVCGKSLQPFLGELTEALERHGEMTLAEGLRECLQEMNASTIDRLLKPYRRLGLRRPFSTTKPGSLLKAAIPIRTFTEWNENRPGFLEIDLVAHCGDSTEGFYLNTLSAVDVATGGWNTVGSLGRARKGWAAPYTT